jgi:secretion/DNA translocation related TadE-like protein
VSRERGSVTVVVLVLGLLIVTASVAVVARGIAVIGRHEAQAGADLAALAGADRVLEGSAAACAAAGTIARRNGATLVSCTVAGDVVEIEVTRSVRVTGIGTWSVGRRARAGPAGETP